MDPNLFFSDPYPDPDPTFQEILNPALAPDPDLTQLLSKNNHNYGYVRLLGSVITDYGP